MGRFGLLASWREPQDDDDNDEEEKELEEVEEEPPHPLPFSPNWGRTRFSLHPPEENYPQLQQRVLGRSEALNEEILELQVRQQYFPPISQYWDASTASAGALMEYSKEQEQPKRDGDDDDIDELVKLFSPSKLTSPPPKHVQIQNQVGQKLKVISEAVAREEQKLEQWLVASQKKMERDNAIAQNKLQIGIKADYEVAKAYLKQEKQQKQDEEELVKQQEEAVRLEQKAQEEVARQVQKEKDQIKFEDVAKEEKVAQAKAEIERKKSAETAYITDAKSLVEKLAGIRDAVQPFDKNKAVSKRRMNMKKMCRGKVNTLAAEVGKVQSVAAELIAALQAEKQVDEQVLGQIQQGVPEVTSDMAKGEAYFLDLLASSALVRIQAEGFNGPRGDGFPLAAFLAMVSSEIKDFAPIFEAHIYAVCPTAIPALPKPNSNASEDDLMESLGMTKNKNGEFESFERFLQRTEGIVSIVANIMASHPESHCLFGGQKSAIMWLERFISLLPAKPEQLPLNTAPVLDAFLTGTGHMLANLHADEFKRLLNVIVGDLVTRLDEGSIGAPRAHRLKETVKGGFEGFKNNLPSKGLAQLYNDGGSAPPPMPAAPPPQAARTGLAPNPFGAPPSSSPSPFGQAPSPFGGQVNSNPFGAAPAAENQMSNGTGMESSGGASSGFSSAAPPMGGQPSPFGGPVVAAFGAPTNNQAPFGAPNASAAPFGSTAPNPFGGGGTSGQPKQAATFGSNPFEATNTQSAPFGNSDPQQQNASPFGGTQQNPSPFGTTQQQNPSPFGATQQQQNQSPFGGTQQQQNPSSYGGQSQAASFGGNYPSAPSNKKKQAPPCRFFAQGRCRNGDNCKFSHDAAAGGSGSGYN